MCSLWGPPCGVAQIKDKGFNVLREAGDVEELLNRGRMDVMLGQQQSERWEILAEGPRKERPEWVMRKLGPTINLPPVKALPSMAETLGSGLVLPTPAEVWSIAKHEVADDVFTREAEQREAEAREIEEKRKELERALQVKAPPKRQRPPEELEEALGTPAYHPPLPSPLLSPRLLCPPLQALPLPSCLPCLHCSLLPALPLMAYTGHPGCLRCPFFLGTRLCFGSPQPLSRSLRLP